MCRIVNWKGLTAYNATSPSNISLDQILLCGFLRHFMVNSLQEKIVSYLLSISLSEPRRGGVRSNYYLKFWIVKRENMNESGPAGKEVRRIFCSNSVCMQLLWTTSSPSVEGDWPRSLVWYWQYKTWRSNVSNNKMELEAYNVKISSNIRTKRFGVSLPRTLFGRPSTGENCVVSIIYSIEWTGKRAVCR